IKFTIESVRNYEFEVHINGRQNRFFYYCHGNTEKHGGGCTLIFEYMNIKQSYFPLKDETDLLIKTAIGIHKILGFGFLEIVYKDAFGHDQVGFVVRWAGELHAYQNVCPHWSTPLNAEGGDDFFDLASGTLICQMHGARFEPDTGLCISGPCLGESLRSLHVRVEGETAHVSRTSGISI
ncbi:MAG: Rieske 2Fe-2S domain-containing protein, partial [Bradymonadaceae bacterium]